MKNPAFRDVKNL